MKASLAIRKQPKELRIIKSYVNFVYILNRMTKNKNKVGVRNKILLLHFINIIAFNMMLIT